MQKVKSLIFDPKMPQWLKSLWSTSKKQCKLSPSLQQIQSTCKQEAWGKKRMVHSWKCSAYDQTCKYNTRINFKQAN